MCLAGAAQPPDSRPPKPLTNLFTTNMVIGARYPSASADRSLVEIQVTADIMDMLMESPGLRYSESLPETLASLRRMLTLTGLAVHAYKNTPLAETLSHNLAAKVEQCRQLLRDLLNDLTNYRYALSGAMLHFIRQYVWSNIGESGTVSVLNSKLQECHTSFASCILALGRAAWPELEQRPQAEAVALADFYSLLQQEWASLRHIKVDTVIVVDHLGRNLPVPKIFCNSWQDFHVVISGFCRTLAGDALIQRGDYSILTPDDDQIIDRSKISSLVHAGMTVEMSVVLRQNARGNTSDEERTCPRCRHINRKVITKSGWLTCQICGGDDCAREVCIRDLIDRDGYGEDGNALELVCPATQPSERDTMPEDSCFFRRIFILLKERASLPSLVNLVDGGRPPSPRGPPSRTPTGTSTNDGRPILFYVKALYDYAATIDEEFDFQSGDVIAVTATPEDGWWSGQLLDETRRVPGREILPSNFVCLY
ncbi:hypothetical protein FIBSPDRAFT_936589 [Athelia psychrophila]|uniref:SH3 domain-containing protein n=1 Tax=Athelia psychrophila TaxID=1759441 RepID=A0A166BU10_9AGAM|nr:hypothetical protein FIBSPDRAFT_936589 [Fibularhizoctonia sp. CBS 109695]